MRNSLRIALAAAVLGAGMWACEDTTPTPVVPTPTQQVLTQQASAQTPLATSSPAPTPTATERPLGVDNNPFVYVYGYDATKSFEILEEKVEDFKGTVVDSSQGYMSVWTNKGGGTIRPFTWLVLKDQANSSNYYFIYPTEREFQRGAKLNILSYWPIKDDVILMNNMLVYLTNMIKSDGIGYFSDLDFAIQSGAPDGHVDGIISFNGIEQIDSIEISLPTSTSVPTPTPTYLPTPEATE